MLLLFCWPLTSSTYELYSHNAHPHGRDLVRCFATLESFARGIDRKRRGLQGLLQVIPAMVEMMVVVVVGGGVSRCRRRVPSRWSGRTGCGAGCSGLRAG